MNKTEIMTAAILVLASFAQAAMADNRAPPELMANITPGYRTGDMQSNSGTQYVLVKRIEGRDSAGNKQVLFSDQQGALLPVTELSQASKLINPVSIEKKGDYHDLQLQLGDDILALQQDGMKRQSRPSGMATQVALLGKIQVHKFEVLASGLSLQQPGSKHGKMAVALNP